jgi:hypothetical protein
MIKLRPLTMKSPSPLAPYLASVKYQLYAGSNVHWQPSDWDQEFSYMASLRIERVTIRNPLDSFFPGYSAAADPRPCDKNYSACKRRIWGSPGVG